MQVNSRNKITKILMHNPEPSESKKYANGFLKNKGKPGDKIE